MSLTLQLVGIACLVSSALSAQTASQARISAAWAASGAKGIRSLEGADGFTARLTKGGSACISTRAGTKPPSTYLYFGVDPDRKRALPSPLYVIVEYYDDTLGGHMALEYDSRTGDAVADKYRHAEERAGGWTLGLKRWQRAYYRLDSPRFAGRQNCGADLRLSGTRMYVRAVRITSDRPADWAKVNTMPKLNIKPKVHIGAGGQFIVGGFDPARASDVAAQTAALEGSIPGLKSLGVTSHEGYVRWNLCEPSEGRYDWSVYDTYVRVYKRHGLKWVPFLIVGSPYSLPDWYYKKPGSQGYVCLEHGLESDVQSLWNPVLKRHIARFLKAFCEHYRDQGVIETILLGVTGNYGEAIYIASGNDWTADIHGPYHTHGGFWAGDPYAVESFRAWLIRKYGGFDRLRDAWNASFGSIGEVKPFLKRDAPNERAWLDMCDWYIGSMTEWSKWWMSETRKHFPKGDIQLCTGGHAPPEHGANFGDQCKLAASVGGGVRITNEGSDYRANFSLTRWVASAGRQYGAHYSFEPAGEVNEKGVIARVYGATASGARGLHYYFPNLFGSDAARANFEKWGSAFAQRRPIVEVAVYYPQTHIKLNGNDFLGLVQPLRDRFDFDYMSDEQILDGGLRTVRALILMHGSISEQKVWSAIAAWARRGGLILYADSVGRLRTVEGDDSIHDAVLNPAGGRAIVFEGRADSVLFRDFLVRSLAAAPELSPGARAAIAADGVEDNVFVTLCAPNELLWLNYTDKPVRKGSSTLQPWSIGSTRTPMP